MSTAARTATRRVWRCILLTATAIGLAGCGSSSDDATTAATTRATPSTEVATPTCTSAAPTPTTTASPITEPAATEPAATEPAASDAQDANTGTFTFDVVCQRFGDCVCDAALAEPLTTTISFAPDGVTLTSAGNAADADATSITYAATGDGTYRLAVDPAEDKVATIRFTATGFVFTLTIAGAPCSEQTYTRR